jgi:hypothetical protein
MKAKRKGTDLGAEDAALFGSPGTVARDFNRVVVVIHCFCIKSLSLQKMVLQSDKLSPGIGMLHESRE